MSYTLYNGNCLDILPLKADFTLTSPPYKNEDVPFEYYKWFSEFLEQVKKSTKHFAFIFNSSTRLIEICRRFDPVRILLWYKVPSMFAYKYEPIFLFNCGTDLKINKYIYRDLFNYMPVRKSKISYKNPIKLYEELLKIIKNAGGKTILDPCLGSGTTMEAAQNLQLNCIGIEIDNEKCEYIKKRCFTKRFLSHQINCKIIQI